MKGLKVNNSITEYSMELNSDHEDGEDDEDDEDDDEDDEDE